MLADASPGAQKRAQGIVKRQGVTYVNVVAANDIAAAYHVDSFPRQVVIGRTGIVEFYHVGGEASVALTAAVEKALKTVTLLKPSK
jgi:hypothetical protein